MSHHATNWAIKQRGIKPGLKVVLWHLADCHNPAFGGAFPSQDYLSEQCEIPRSTLNVYLDQLEAAGLIAREQRRKAGSQTQERTRYYFPFDPEFETFSTTKPSPETGHGAVDAESRNGGEPSPENGESRVQNLDSNPVMEPVKEPVNEREARERDDFGSKDRENAAKAFKRWHPTWPSYVHDSDAKALKAWLELSGDERQEAAEKSGEYVEACKETGRKHICSAQVYLAERRWKKIEAMRKEEPKKERPDLSAGVMVPVFGPAWASARMDSLFSPPVSTEVPLDIRERKQGMFDVLANTSVTRAENWALRNGLSIGVDGKLIFPEGFEMQEAERREREEGWPEVNRLHEAAKSQNHVRVAAIYERTKWLCEAVPVGSAMWQRWAEWHEHNNRPFVPEPRAMQVVYFPKGGPEGLDDFRAAIEAALITARDEASDDAA